MTNALAGGIPSPPCRLRAESFAASGRRKEQTGRAIKTTWCPRGSPRRSARSCGSSALSPVCGRQLISGVTIRQRPPGELHELYLEINRIGTNINQIARKANAGFVTKDDMKELKFLMRTIEQKMAKVADQ